MNKADKASPDSESQARAWLLRLRSGEATEDDAQAFRRWCAQSPENAQAARRINRTWRTMNTALANVLAEDARAGKRLAPPRPVHAGRRAFAGFALAAGASWLALRPPLQLWPSVVDLTADYRTGTGEQRQVAISDRVAVEMNTQTRFDLLPKQGGANRIDLLAGEAEIIARPPAAPEALPDARAVDVVAGRGRMQARVARFNVRRNGAQVCVTCVSGSVTLAHPERRLTLGAAQQVVYDDRRVGAVSKVDPAVATGWREGILIFNDVPLSEVIDEINRYRPGRLILRNRVLGEHLIQARLSIHDLDGAVELIRVLSGAQMTRLPGRIVLLS